jgi:SAM-dependent methyltransferase
VFKIIRNKIKNTGIFGHSSYGKTWQEREGNKQNDWYDQMHESHKIQHQDFIQYLKTRKNLETVLEVGCGTGVYPIKLKELFANIKYTGTDISETAIKQCKKNSSFEFIAGDFIKLDISRKFDLVFSHAVVDHVYDMDEFVAKIVNLTKKYAYITAYRGFFPDLKKHKMNWHNEDGSFYNDFSIIQINKKLKEMGLNENEFDIRSLKVDDKNDNLDYQTIIEIEKIV